ncbi:MAG TPA: methylated-DNA--[protein]-cysteine S-methyltransferase [Gemmatimonadaceae bacterium]
MSTAIVTIPSPVGELLLTARDDGLTGVWFENHRAEGGTAAEWQRAQGLDAADLERADGGSRGAVRILRDASEQLAAYFAGTRTTFDVPLSTSGTPFQERVWAALRGIPYGHTVSYGELARRLGEPKAMRAVGAANGRNPLPIIVPCHRVIGARGELTGFGGGIERKRWLLEHEGALASHLFAVDERLERRPSAW